MSQSVERPQFTLGYSSSREDARNEFNARVYQADAYQERTRHQGASAHADRQARVRTDGLRLAVDLVNGLEGEHSVEDVLTLAERFSAFILGYRDADTPPPPFPGIRKS